MAVLPWGMLSGGLLSGKYLQANPDGKRLNNPALSPYQAAVLEEVLNIADEVGRTPSQVAINWVRQQQARASIIPMIGARTLAQLQDNLDCLTWALSPSQ